MQLDHSQIWDYSQISPYVITALAVLLAYRRLRRSFGRQRIRPVRMRVRMGILIVLGCLLLPMTVGSGQFLAAELAGIVVGASLGVWGARRTRYQTYDGQLHYIPHTYAGIAVSLLFVGRLVYRIVLVQSVNHLNAQSGADPTQGFGSPTMGRSPFTVGSLFLVIGYYVCYYSMVLWKSKRISPEDLEVSPTSTAVPP
jgi:uncharacterized membrane protein YczE